MIDRKREQVAKGVCVHVTRRVQEMADVAPPDLVLFGEDQGVAEHRLQLLLEHLA